MSYLSPLRLHFAGRFQANIPTINNDPRNYDPAVKLPNPSDEYMRGDCTWRLLGCSVTSAFDSRSRQVSRDPVLSLTVADSDRQAPAKIVDLDPQQQLSPVIFGLEIRLCDGRGRTLLRSKFTPASMADMFRLRTPTTYSDGQLSACFQSTLTQLEWANDLKGSRWLLQLKKACAATGKLSIKFNLDAYVNELDTPNFATGRIVGTIGPAEPNEPEQLILGRHLLPPPNGKLNHAVAVVDKVVNKIRIDLGNSLSTEFLGGGFADVGRLLLACGGTNLGTIPYRPDDPYVDWYALTAGVVELPQDRKLTKADYKLLEDTPLTLYATNALGERAVVLCEPRGGLYCRADDRVFRLSPGDPPLDVAVYATRFGRPLPKARLYAFHDVSALQLGEGPPMAEPKAALTFDPVTVTDDTGRATLRLLAADPGRPRPFLDGQVYAVRVAIEETLAAGAKYPFPSGDVVSVRVWEEFSSGPKVGWKTIRDMLKPYKRLYPVMSRFLDLTNPLDLHARRDILIMSLLLEIEDPNHMPVTRDLSPKKRDALVRWLGTFTPKAKANAAGTLNLPKKSEVTARALSPQSAAARPKQPARRSTRATKRFEPRSKSFVATQAPN